MVQVQKSPGNAKDVPIVESQAEGGKTLRQGGSKKSPSDRNYHADRLGSGRSYTGKPKGRKEYLRAPDLEGE